MRVRFTPSARAQFLQALDFIRTDSPRAARSFRSRVEKSLRRLLEFPDSGLRIPEFRDLPYRELIVRPYRIFYRIAGRTVWIVAFWHGAQLPGKPPSVSG